MSVKEIGIGRPKDHDGFERFAAIFVPRSMTSLVYQLPSA